MSTAPERFVGLQLSPINFVDEGSSRCSTCSRRATAINAVLIGTVSWLGLKAGAASPRAEGWPDHGAQRRSR